MRSRLENFNQTNLKYTITELNSFYSPGGSNGQGLDINNLGQVVGRGINGNALLYSDGTLTELGKLNFGTLNHISSQPTSINDLGQIVGYSTYIGNGGRAFIYSDGELEFLSSLGDTNQSKAYDINNLGQITGEAKIRLDNGFYAHRGFILDQNGLIMINPLME